MNAPPNVLPFLVIVPLVIWRMYGRIRRQIGRQTLSKVRPWITVTVFPLILILIALGSAQHPASLAAMAGGVAAGVLLGVFGLTKTVFENTPQGMFYTPHAHLGIAVSVIFVGRMFYRFYQIYSMNPGAQPDASDFTSTPLSVAVFGLLVGYYVSYAVGLIRYRQRALQEPPSSATGST